MKLGFIGAGNMAKALMTGIVTSNVLPPDHVYAYDTDSEKLDKLSEELHINKAGDNLTLAQFCDVILLAVKPGHIKEVLKELESIQNKAFISIAAGWTKEQLSSLLHESCRVLRVMPNTPCLVGEGMVVFDEDHSLTEEELTFAKQLFSSVGRVATTPSRLMSAVTGISGSGPAYVYLFIEAMADAGVLNGLDRNTAYELAAQTVMGAGKMVLHTRKHPGALKDAVCSPGGTTIEAVCSLEQDGFRSGVINAVCACTDKAKKMEQNQ